MGRNELDMALVKSPSTLRSFTGIKRVNELTAPYQAYLTLISRWKC